MTHDYRDNDFGVPWTPGAPSDPAERALAVYKARAFNARCMANTTIRDLRRDPGNGILVRRFVDYRDRFREANCFYWAQRRRLAYMDTAASFKARQAAKRRTAA